MLPTNRNRVRYFPAWHFLESFLNMIQVSGDLCPKPSSFPPPPYLTLVILDQRQHSHRTWTFQDERESIWEPCLVQEEILYVSGILYSWDPGQEQMFFLSGSQSSPCLKNKSGFSFRAHLVPTFTFGETEVYDQVQFHKDSWMYKFQSCFRRIFGFYFCVFYGRGFYPGTSGLLPYSLPIVTVGKCCFQPQDHPSSFLTSTSTLPIPPPPKKREAERDNLGVGVDLASEWIRPREEGG